jgi:acetyl esterase
VSIGGASAGGNIAAAVSLMAKDGAGPHIVFQILEIPVTDFTALGPLEIPAEGLSIPSGKETYRKYYLSDPEWEALHPYASPLHAKDLTKLPPALVMCAEYDALQPEALAFAQRLRAVGVEAEYHCGPGQFHGSQGMSKLIPNEAAAYRAMIAQALLNAYRYDVAAYRAHDPVN